MDHLKNLLAGLASVLVLAPGSDYVRPERGGFARDARNLRGDVRRVGADMRNVTERYGQQIDYRKG